MLTLGPGVPIYLCPEPVDCRRSFDGLLAAARERLARDVREGGLFLFGNRRGDQLRALCFDRNGLVVLAKRLDRGRFCWPTVAPGVRELRLEVRELALLLAGLPLAAQVPPSAGVPSVHDG